MYTVNNKDSYTAIHSSIRVHRKMSLTDVPCAGIESYLTVWYWQRIPGSNAPQHHFDVSQCWHLSAGTSTTAANSPTSPLSATRHLDREVMVWKRARCSDMMSDWQRALSEWPTMDLWGGVLCSEPGGDGWVWGPTHSAVHDVRAVVGTLAQCAAQILKRKMKKSMRLENA